jgi:hypothetical protein
MFFSSRNIQRIEFSSFFILILALTSCQKELSFDSSNNPGSPSNSTAIFTLVPSGSNCSDAVASGVFEVSKTLSIDSKLTLTVSVSKTGQWSYSTNSVNGFAFAGSGTFTSTGSQTIILQATGIPVAAGNFNIPLNLNGSSCSAVVTVSPLSSGGIGTSVYYYKATIGGINYSQNVTASNGYEAGSGSAGVDDVSFGAGIYYANTPVPAGSTGMGVEKGVMHNYLSATNVTFKAFFTPGNYPYAPPGFHTFDNGNGVAIGWSDPSGEYWDSHAGTADQTGSTFKIISVVDSYDAIGNYYITVKMQFNCKLYNINTGAVKQLTNGEMVGLFGKL